MTLTAFNQYCIRKILAEYLEQMGDSIAHWMSTYPVHQTDLNQILKSLGHPQCEHRIEELETLLQIYQELGHQTTLNIGQIRHIKQRILWLVGLRLTTIQSAHVPHLLPEPSAAIFRFNRETKVQEGLLHNGELYGLVQVYSPSHRLQAYHLALALADRQVPLLVTKATHRYAIWLPLRSQAYRLYAAQGQAFIDRILAIHQSLCRAKEVMTHRDMQLSFWQTAHGHRFVPQLPRRPSSSIKEFASYSRLQQTICSHCTQIPRHYTQYILGQRSKVSAAIQPVT